MASMDNREEPTETLRQYAVTYVDELIRLAPPCGQLTAEMRADTIALVEWAMHDLVRVGSQAS